jgi:uncharacterized protein YbbK (DUF523 family)
MAEKIIVSACLLGINCRYDGTNSLNEKLLNYHPSKYLIPLCPEQMGGLTTPRPKAEIEMGDGADVLAGMSRVLDINGMDVTAHFIRGAEEVLKVARLFDIRGTVLKEKSPSCGVNLIYRGKKLVKGMGIVAALLKNEGLEVTDVE